MTEPIDHEKFRAVQEAIHPIVIGKPLALKALPDDISTASLEELADRFDAQIARLLGPDEFRGDLPPGSKAGSRILPGEVKLDLELGMTVHGGFPPHPGWYTKRNTLALSKDRESEREEPLKRNVSLWTQESASPRLGISEEDRLKNVRKTRGVSLTYESFVGVPLNIPILTVLGIPFNHDDKANVRVNVAPDRLPKPDERLGFAVGILIMEDLLSSQLEPGAKTKY